jgi:hypothetical protein
VIVLLLSSLTSAGLAVGVVVVVVMVVVAVVSNFDSFPRCVQQNNTSEQRQSGRRKIGFCRFFAVAEAACDLTQSFAARWWRGSG